MKILKYIVFATCFLSGCAQNPAPVENYNTKGKIRNYYDINTDSKSKDQEVSSEEIEIVEKIGSVDGNTSESPKKNTAIESEKVDQKQKYEDEFDIDSEIKSIVNKDVKNEKNLDQVNKKDDSTTTVKEKDKISESSSPENKVVSFSNPVNGKLQNKFKDIIDGQEIKGIYVSSIDGVVKASIEGEVLYSGYDNDFGNLVITKSKIGNDQMFIVYANLSSLRPKKGDSVNKGTVLGEVEINKKVYIAFRKNRDLIDPLSFLKY